MSFFGVMRLDAAFFLFSLSSLKQKQEKGNKESGVKPPHSKVRKE
jgi:hypothetical protein